MGSPVSNNNSPNIQVAKSVLKMDSQENEDTEIGVQKIVENFNLINEVQRKLETLQKAEPSIQMTKDQTKKQLEDLLRQLETVQEMSSALQELKKMVHEEIMSCKNYIDCTLSRRRSSCDIESLLGISGRRSCDSQSELGLSRRSDFSIEYEASRRSLHIESEPGQDKTLAITADPGVTSKRRQRRVRFIQMDGPDSDNAKISLPSSINRSQSDKALDCLKVNGANGVFLDSKEIQLAGHSIVATATWNHLKTSPGPEIKQVGEAETKVSGDLKRSSRSKNEEEENEIVKLGKHGHRCMNGDSKQSAGGQSNKKKSLTQRLSKIFTTCAVCGFALYLSKSFGRCLLCKSKETKKKIKQKHWEL